MLALSWQKKDRKRGEERYFSKRDPIAKDKRSERTRESDYVMRNSGIEYKVKICYLLMKKILVSIE